MAINVTSCSADPDIETLLLGEKARRRLEDEEMKRTYRSDVPPRVEKVLEGE